MNRLPIIAARRSAKGAPVIEVRDGGRTATIPVSAAEMMRARERLNQTPPCTPPAPKPHETTS